MCGLGQERRGNWPTGFSKGISGFLGALVAKAAATTIPLRDNPARDWQDAALLLTIVGDPVTLAETCEAKDRTRLRRLLELQDRAHEGWELADDDDHRRGVTTLKILCDA
jgi:hypothetical protein